MEGLRTHRFWLAFFLACLLHALGTKLAAVRGFRKLRIGAFCLAWARILLLFGRFASAPSRHHGTSADGLAGALLSAPPRHLALRYTGFGPSRAARVLATRKNVLWIPKVTGSIFSGLCFWLAWARPVVVFGLFGSVAHELHFCVCAGYRLLICYGPLPPFFFTASKLQFRHRVEGLRTHRFWLARARLVVAFGLFGSVASSFSDPASQRGCWPQEMFYGFQRWREAFFLACVFGLPELGLLWCLAFSDPLPTSFIFVSVQVIGCLSATVLYLYFFYGFEAAVSAPCGRVANASFLACPSSACSGVWPFRIRCQQFRHHVEGLRTHRFWLAFFLACVLHALGTNMGSNPAAVRAVRMGSSTAFCLAWILLLFGRAVYWFRTPPRSEGAGHKKCFMDSKDNGKHFFCLVFSMPWARILLLFEAFGSFA